MAQQCCLQGVCSSRFSDTVQLMHPLCRMGRQAALQHCPFLGKASQAATCPPACATVAQATAWMLGQTGAGMRTACVSPTCRRMSLRETCRYDMQRIVPLKAV
jgi:hypothetical protein